MRDWTLTAYQNYILEIKKHYSAIITFTRYFQTDRPDSFCIVRHDVDRKPENALKMAELENNLGVKATYYFRMKSCSFVPALIKKISSLGHEIGYHYENLSDTQGDVTKAIEDFSQNLATMRSVCEIKTISMHGRPFSRFDNRDLWNNGDNRKKLKTEFGIAGEVYLDIDYSDIAYITDTGRNWRTGRFNIRDKTNSNVPVDFKTSGELLDYLSNKPHPKLIFQIHPERWNDGYLSWTLQWMRDLGANRAKKALSMIRK